MEHDSRNLDVIDTTDFSPSIGRIAENRMPQRRKMHTELMGSTRPGIEQDMSGNFSVPLIHLIFRHGFSWTGRPGRYLFPLFGVSSDRQFDEPMTLFRNAPDERLIDTRDCMFLKLCSKVSMSLIGLGNHHDAGRFLVQTMHKTRPWF
jgi:hypothetical protein